MSQDSLTFARCDCSQRIGIVYAIQINNAGIEYSEQISIDLNIAVITTCLPLGNSAADSNAGTSPSPASIIAVCEDVVANCYVTDTGLFEPEVTVALKEDRGSGDMEIVVFDDNPSAGTNQQPRARFPDIRQPLM